MGSKIADRGRSWKSYLLENKTAKGDGKTVGKRITYERKVDGAVTLHGA